MAEITSAVIGFWIPVVRQFNLRFFVSFGGVATPCNRASTMEPESTIMILVLYW